MVSDDLVTIADWRKAKRESNPDGKIESECKKLKCNDK